MEITKEFLQCEIEEIERELQKAVTFQIQAQSTISAYRMLIQRLTTQDPQLEPTDAANPSN